MSFNTSGVVTALLVALVVGSFGFASEAQAQDETNLLGALKGLKWGDSVESSLKFFKKTKLDEFQAENKKVRDAILKESRRKIKMDQYQTIEKSYRTFKGSGQTGYEVSVITGEFEKNNGESLLVVRDSVAQRYYFFQNRRLWKMAVSYNADYVRGIGFEAFVEQVGRKYGEPGETVYDADEVLRRAIWVDNTAELRIEDKSDFFGTFIMVFSDPEVLKRRGALLESFVSQEEKLEKKKVRAQIEDIQADGGFDVDADVVDSIVGVDIKVNLERGMPEGAEVRRVGDPVKAKAELPEEGPKKRKKGRKGVRGKKGGKKGAVKGGGKKKSNDDLIIY